MVKKVLFIAIASLMMAACSQDKSDLGMKKAALEKLMKEQTELNAKVTALRKEIDELDTAAKSQKKIKSIDVTPAVKQEFRHYIEASAVVETDQNTVVTAKQPGFVITNVLVKAGDNVRAGQVLCTVDNSTIIQSKEALNVQYELAKTAYQRQKNLWEKQIGSEIQYLQSKTQKEALEKQLASIESQIANTSVVAPFNGTVEAVNFKVGDNTMNPMGGIRVVNLSLLKISAKLADSYISKVHRGDRVKIVIPDLNNKEIDATLSFVGNTINNFRTFDVQIMLANNTELKPNMTALIKINDLTMQKVFVLSENLVQSSEGQKSIYVLKHDGPKTIAKKLVITTGSSYGGLVVVEGLSEGDEVITTGYASVNDGEEVKHIK